MEAKVVAKRVNLVIEFYCNCRDYCADLKCKHSVSARRLHPDADFFPTYGLNVLAIRRKKRKLVNENDENSSENSGQVVSQRGRPPKARSALEIQ